MIPGMGGMNPRQMQRMMQQMGIKSEEIKAARVVIEKEGEKIIIDEPQVTLIEMQGQKSYQIVGKERFEAAISDEDVKMVVGQTGASEADARKALEESGGDIAEAIMKLEK
ncbi:MAG: nascent polypeptide-associated complex protein [Candidatus Micrarchaeota archaeon]